MKYLVAVISGALFAGQQSQAGSDSQTIAVGNLSDIGVNQTTIIQRFKDEAGIDLKANDSVKVTSDDEGKNFKFETLDHLSVVVDIQHACGVGNKDNLQD